MIKRRVWCSDEPGKSYSRCPECEMMNMADVLIKELGRRTRETWCKHLLEEVDGGDSQTWHVYEVHTVRGATVYFAGERAAGLLPHSYHVELWVHVHDYDTEAELLAALNAYRTQLQDAYEALMGDKPRVTFDYEDDV